MALVSLKFNTLLDKRCFGVDVPSSVTSASWNDDGTKGNVGSSSTSPRKINVLSLAAKTPRRQELEKLGTQEIANKVNHQRLHHLSYDHPFYSQHLYFQYLHIYLLYIEVNGFSSYSSVPSGKNQAIINLIELKCWMLSFALIVIELQIYSMNARY